MKKILITGISGFVGSFLAEHSAAGGSEIFGAYVSETGLNNLESIKDKIKFIKIDLNNFSDVENLVKTVRPEIIYHLAALTETGESFKNPGGYIFNNINAQINLLEAVKRENLNSRTLIVSSAEIYGAAEKAGLPADENLPFRPVSPYGVSKAAQDMLALQYFLAFGLDIVRVRPFNHIGPRQSTHFAAAAFARKIALIEKGKKEPVLEVGNLKAKRDFTDVRDIVRAYELLSEKGLSGEVYNVGSGKAVKISVVLDTLLSFSKVRVEIREDPEFLRPKDLPGLICDNTKIKKLTGWEPRIPLEQTLRDTLNYWREAV